jgi:8-amino-7-oxononanoate synthase
VLGAPEVIVTLVDTGRGFIFDTGRAALRGRGLAALGVVAAEEDLRVSALDAAVLAVTVGESARAVRAKEACAAYGVRVGCFRPPSVPRGQACLRLTGRASLTEDDFAAAARALAAVRDDEDQGGRR